MQQIKKLAQISGAWNIGLGLLMFFQGSILLKIIIGQLFPSIKYVRPIAEERFSSYIQAQCVKTAIIVILLILIEIIAFFVVNAIIARKYKRIAQDTQLLKQRWGRRLSRYFCYINIYGALMLAIFLGGIVIFALSLAKHTNAIDFSMQNPSVAHIHNLILSADFSSLAKIEELISAIIAEIKNNSALYKLINTAINSISFMQFFVGAWTYLSYGLLGFGIYLHARLLRRLDWCELLEESQSA